MKIIICHILAFFTIGWGIGIIMMITMPIVLLFGRGNLGRLMGFLETIGVAFIATYSVKWVCSWFAISPTYSMFLLPIIMIISNGLNRIQRASIASTFCGVNIDEDPQMRDGMISTEKAYLLADIIGFTVAIFILSPLQFF